MKNQISTFPRPVGFILNITKFLFISFILFSLSCNKSNPVGNNSDTHVYGTMTDIDGNVYKTIKIGNQVWMAENLRTTKYNDGTPISHFTDSSTWVNLTTSGYCYYNNTNNPDSIIKFGALYNWYTVTNKTRLAPTGWHIPSDSEWYTLQYFLIANGYNYDGTTTDNKIAKAMAAQTDWQTFLDSGVVGNNLTKNNKSGFSALPAGFNWYGKFSGIGNNCVLWTDTKSDTSLYVRVLSYAIEYLIKDSVSLNMHVGGSIRLLKDN